MHYILFLYVSGFLVCRSGTPDSYVHVVKHTNLTLAQVTRERVLVKILPDPCRYVKLVYCFVAELNSMASVTLHRLAVLAFHMASIETGSSVEGSMDVDMMVAHTGMKS